MFEKEQKKLEIFRKNIQVVFWELWQLIASIALLVISTCFFFNFLTVYL